jgi:hypothetical protein
MRKLVLSFIFGIIYLNGFAQIANSDTVFVGQKVITLSEVVVGKKLDIPVFINRIIQDSSFYKAFKNLHIVNYSAINDIRLLGKKNVLYASLFSRTQQFREGACRSMKVLEEKVSGDYYDQNHQLNYYTAQLYAALFFTDGMKCGETNIVGGKAFSVKNKSGLDKHKEQLKMLFFNPGKKIEGLPFISGKTAIFDDDMADRYNFEIDMQDYNKVSCFVLKQKVKPGYEDDVVLDEMTTWLDANTYDVLARNYSLSYDAGVYDFNVSMEVKLKRLGALLLPELIRYNGDWKMIFKKRERGIFTATLFDFF